MIRSPSKTQLDTRKKNSFPFEIAIPTYDTPVVLRDTTLNILKAYKIPFSKITLFVLNQKQEQLYKSLLLPNTYGKIINTVSKTLAEHYTSIQMYYPYGFPIVYVKDNIKCIVELNSLKEKTVQPVKSFLSLCKKGFAECEKAKARLWGSCSSFSEINDSVTTSLQYISGNIWGSINPGNEIQITQNSKEDYERSILYYKKDNAVVRINNVVVLNCIETQDTVSAEKAVKYMMHKYPEYISVKKSNPLEIQIKESKL